MTLIDWKEEFSLGVPGIDHEHRQLIGLINDWYDNLAQDNSTDTKLDFLGEAYAQISAHFALEERLMRQKRYEQYEDHKADHEVLLDQLTDIMDTVETDERFDDGQLSTRLNQWFSDHFQNMDARLHGKLG